MHGTDPIATVDAIYASVYWKLMSVVQPSSMIVKVNNNVLLRAEKSLQLDTVSIHSTTLKFPFIIETYC